MLLDNDETRDEAIAQAEQSVRVFGKLFGDRHPHYANALNTLAVIYMNAGRTADARPALEQAIKIAEDSLGVEDPLVGISRFNFARLLQDSGKLEEAEPYFRQAVIILAKFTAKTGVEHHRLHAATYGYLLALLRLQDAGKSHVDKLFVLGPEIGWEGKEWFEFVRGVLGSQDPDEVPVERKIANQAVDAVRRGDFDRAVELWQEALRLASEKPSPLPDVLYHYRLNLAAAKLNRGKPGDPETAGDELAALLKELQNAGVRTFDTAGTHHHLARAYQTLGKPEEAKEQVNKALDLYEELGIGDAFQILAQQSQHLLDILEGRASQPSEADKLSATAMQQFNTGLFGEAKQTWEKALELLDADPVGDPQNTLVVRMNIGAARIGLREYAQARDDLLKLVDEFDNLKLVAVPTARTHHHLARAFLALGERVRAKIHLEQALRTYVDLTENGSSNPTLMAETKKLLRDEFGL